MATKTHTFSDSHIQLNVTEPTNVTGNNAYISQKFWTDGATPSDTMTGIDGNGGNSDKYSWYGKFISCMELDWGNAKGSESDFTNMTETDINNLLFTKGIKTSDELLQVLCWLFKNRSQSPDSFATISDTTITRPKNTTLSGISWTGGSVSLDSVISGDEITFNKGTVIAIYGNNNGTTIITTSNISGVLTITSSNTSVITINNVVKNGQTTITGIKAGNATITVKDDEKVVNEFNVTVENGSNTVDVTNSTTFEDSKGSSIDGTTITAPTVTSDETITITAKFGGKTASTEISYTVKPAVTNYYYYYAGWTKPTATNVDTIIAETYPSASGSSTNHTAGKKTTSKSTMDYTSNTLYNANAKATYYVLVPTGHAIYDSLNNNVVASTFTSNGNITVGNQTHTIYASNANSRNIGAIIIK